MTEIQAFPAAWGDYEHGGDYIPGMTLRDWFAGQAIAGVIIACSGDTVPPDSSREEEFARKAFQIADAMFRLGIERSGSDDLNGGDDD